MDPAAVSHGSWLNGFIGGSHDLHVNGARLLDARSVFHHIATVITLAVAPARVGAASAYALRDAIVSASTVGGPTGC